jgi:hypothetical protein
MLRQSAASLDAPEKFANLALMRHSSFSSVCSYWSHVPSDIGVFWVLYDDIEKAHSMFCEAITENPNSSSIYEGYAKFLIDSATDFNEAIQMIHRKNLIECSYSFSVGYSFCSLVYSYPFYLKNKILNIQGYFIKDEKQKDEKQIEDMSYQLTKFCHEENMRTTSEQEISICKQILTEPKTRLSFQHAISRKTSRWSWMIKFLSFICLFLSIGVGIVVVSVDQAMFDGIQFTMNQQLFNYKWRLYNDYAFFTPLIYAYHFIPQYDKNDTLLKEIRNHDPNIEQSQMIDPSDLANLKSSVRHFGSIARKSFQSLLNAIAEDSINGTNVYMTSPTYLLKVVNLPICNGSDLKNIQFLSSVPSSIKKFADVFNDNIVNLQFLDPSEYINKTGFCQIIFMIPIIAQTQSHFISILTNFQNQRSRSKYNFAMYQLIFAPISVFIIEFIPYLIFYILYIGELKHLLKLSHSVDERHRETATQPISKFPSEEAPNLAEIVARAHKRRFIFSLIFTIIFTLLPPIIIIVNLIQAMKTALIFSSLPSFKLYESTGVLFSIETEIYLPLPFFKIKDTNKISATNLSIQLKLS